MMYSESFMTSTLLFLNVSTVGIECYKKTIWRADHRIKMGFPFMNIHYTNIILSLFYQQRQQKVFW